LGIYPYREASPDASSAQQKGLRVARVIAVALQKGGVGKTTLTLNLARLLAVRGRRVLAIDADSQAHLTLGLGVTPDPSRTIYQVLVNQAPVSSVQVSVADHSLVPGSPFMAQADLALAPATHREYRLRRALEAERDNYDFVLIDCPPNLGVITLNALFAATDVLIPVQTQQWAIDSMAHFLGSLKDVREYHPTLRVAAIVPNTYDRRLAHQQRALEYLTTAAASLDIPLRRPIGYTTRIAEAAAAHLALCDYDRSTEAATALEELAEWVDQTTVDMGAPA
jgi:chromosome partitioning protein